MDFIMNTTTPQMESKEAGMKEKAVKLLVEECEGLIRQTDFGAEVELEVLFPEANTQPFLERLTDMTAATVEGMETGQEYRAFPVDQG